jgi:hypothetical protein|tara:strand:+ start:220 stop:1887 length:1668 start_codon:yes stop_codon:yes gene_type:complete
LNIKTAFYLLSFSLFFFSNGINGQNLFLKIAATNEKNNLELSKIQFQKKHLDITSIYKETAIIEKHLKSIGYYSVRIQKFLTAKDTTKVTYSLGTKIETALLSIDSLHFKLLKKFNIKNGILKTPASNLENTLMEITKQLDANGFSFSETSLKNTTIKGAVLSADLHIKQSQKRNINSIIVKGYEKFPKSFVKHFLKIDKQTVFTKSKLKEISKRLQSVSFVTQTKPIETLFKKDSTLVYLYLKKKQKSSFDGLLNFNSNESGTLQLNGYLDLKLQNVFNRGEELTILWNRLDEERQELNLKTQIPFLYNSPLSSRFEFSLYKQDSTFLNSQFNTDFSLSLNERLQLAINYDYIESKMITEASNAAETDAFKSQFIGVSFQYMIPMNDVFSSQKTQLFINPKVGQRTSNSQTENQLKIALLASYIFEFNERNSLYVANNSGYLNSASFLQNEIYRIGGEKSIRGFNTQSLFATEYSFFNVAYRFLASKKSLIYTITDFGKFKGLNTSKKALSIGAGYQFLTNNSQVNLSYALGRIDNQPFDYKTPTLNINFVTYF